MSVQIDEADGLRRMWFGTRWCQGAMRIDAPERLELAYALRMFAWLLFHDLDSLHGKHLVTLGLGAGSLTRFAHRVLGMQTTAVEIDPEVIEACRQHFDLPADGAGLHVVQGDAAEYLGSPGLAGSIDVLQVDAYDAAVEAPALDSAAFYAHCRASLRPGGTLAVNLVGEGLDVRASVARIREGLQPRTLWQFPPTEAGNVVVLAHCGDVPPEDELAPRAAAVERQWDLPAIGWLAMARRTTPRRE